MKFKNELFLLRPFAKKASVNKCLPVCDETPWQQQKSSYRGRCYVPSKGYSYRSLIHSHCKCHKPHELKEQSEQRTTNKTL